MGISVKWKMKSLFGEEKLISLKLKKKNLGSDSELRENTSTPTTHWKERIVLENC